MSQHFVEVSPLEHTDQLTDLEFLDALEGHSNGMRCGMTGEQTQRLFLLAGMKEAASEHAKWDTPVFAHQSKTVRELIDAARSRLRLL